MRCENSYCNQPVTVLFRRANRGIKAKKMRACCEEHFKIIEKSAKEHGERLIVERL